MTPAPAKGLGLLQEAGADPPPARPPARGLLGVDQKALTKRWGEGAGGGDPAAVPRAGTAWKPLLAGITTIPIHQVGED